MDDELKELYQEIILDHGKHPRNFGELAGASHEADGYNPLCGDKIHIYLKLSPNGLIEDAGFEGKGCAISIASASIMSEILKGKSVADGKALMEAFLTMVKGEDDEPEDVDEDALNHLRVMSGVSQFPMRVKCATLAWHTFSAAADGDNNATTE